MGKQQTNIKEKGRVSLKEPRRYLLQYSSNR